jgi:hypothetical protein
MQTRGVRPEGPLGYGSTMATNIRSAPPTAVLAIDFGMYRIRVSYTVDTWLFILLLSSGSYCFYPCGSSRSMLSATM